MPTSNNQFVHPETKQAEPNGLVTAGPIIQVEIHVPQVIAGQLSVANQPIPAPVVGLGLVDTGATLTCVHEEVLKKLSLNPVGIVDSGTAAGKVSQNAYACQVRIPANNLLAELSPVIGVNLTGQQAAVPGTPPIIALLGRNLLQHGVFVYNGTFGFWSFSI